MSSAHDVHAAHRHVLPTRAGLKLIPKIVARIPHLRGLRLRARPYPVMVSGPSVTSAGFGFSGEF